MDRQWCREAAGRRWLLLALGLLAAEKLGFTVPQSILLEADEVIR